MILPSDESYAPKSCRYPPFFQKKPALYEQGERGEGLVCLNYEVFEVCRGGSHTGNEDVNSEDVYAVLIIIEDKYNAAFNKDVYAINVYF